MLRKWIGKGDAESWMSVAVYDRPDDVALFMEDEQFSPYNGGPGREFVRRASFLLGNHVIVVVQTGGLDI